MKRHVAKRIDFGTLAGPLDLGLSNGSFTYTGSGIGDIRLRITGLGSGVFNGSIDTLSVSSATIPEPGTALLMLLGLVGLASRRRKRQ